MSNAEQERRLAQLADIACNGGTADDYQRAANAYRKAGYYDKAQRFEHTATMLSKMDNLWGKRTAWSK